MRAHAIVDTAQTLDVRIDDIVSLLQQAQDETDGFGFPESSSLRCYRELCDDYGQSWQAAVDPWVGYAGLVTDLHTAIPALVGTP